MSLLSGVVLITRGGHNPLEPLALAVPIVSGTHVFNFQEVYDQLDSLEAVNWVTADDQLDLVLERLLDDENAQLKTAHAQSLFAQHEGATDRYLDLIDDFLERSGDE